MPGHITHDISLIPLPGLLVHPAGCASCVTWYFLQMWPTLPFFLSCCGCFLAVCLRLKGLPLTRRIYIVFCALYIYPCIAYLYIIYERRRQCLAIQKEQQQQPADAFSIQQNNSRKNIAGGLSPRSSSSIFVKCCVKITAPHSPQSFAAAIIQELNKKAFVIGLLLPFFFATKGNLNKS